MRTREPFPVSDIHISIVKQPLEFIVLEKKNGLIFRAEKCFSPCLKYVLHNELFKQSLACFPSRHTIPDVVLRSGLRNCTGAVSHRKQDGISINAIGPRLWYRVPLSRKTDSSGFVPHQLLPITTVFFVYQGNESPL
jgi:hypothetical protein